MPQALDRRIIFGPFQPDLEEAFLAEVRDLKRDDPLRPALLLVGSNVLGIYLTRLLARRLGGVGGLRVMTFLDVARAAAHGDLVRERLRLLTEAAERLIARKLASSLPRGSYFDSVRETGGFEEALLATLRDLRDGGVTARDLRHAFPADARKIRDLSWLLEQYDARLSEKRFVDRPGLMRRAIGALDTAAKRPDAESPRAALSPLSAASRLLVYGFYDFTWVQEQVLHRLVALLPATIFFPWRDIPAFEYARQTRERLEAMGLSSAPASGSAASPASAASPGPPEEKALARVRRRLFSLPDGTSRPVAGSGGFDPSLRILAAPGEPREAIEAIRAITSLVRAGFQLEDIALLYRAGEEYPALLIPVLQELGIPIFRTDGTPFRPSREARAILMALDIKETDYDRVRVIDFLTLAGTAGLETSSDEPPNSADWDLLTRMAGIISGRHAWGDRLDRLAATLVRKAAAAPLDDDPEAEPPPDPRLILEVRRLPRIFARLARAIDAIPVEGTWTDLARGVAGVVTRFLAPSDGRREVVDILDRLAALQTIEERTTLGEFRRLLEFEIDRRSRSQGHLQRGHLFLGDVLASRGLGFRAVVVLGMVEQSFPVPARQDPILLDDERSALNRKAAPDRGRLPIKAHRSLEERLLFTLATGAARERLTLTFPRIDPSTARERVPSSFLLRVVEAVTGEPCGYEDLERCPAVERVRISDLVPADRLDAIREREFDLSAVWEGVGLQDAGHALLLAGLPGNEPFFRRGLTFEHLRWGTRTLTLVDGRIMSSEARAVLASRHSLVGTPLSPTRLEQYMTCPYQYFCERILGLAPLEAPEQIERLSAGDRGTLMHAILHEFLAGLRASGALPLRRQEADGLRETLLEIVHRRFAEIEKQGLAGLPALAAIDREAIERDLLRVLEDEIEAAERQGPAGLRPAHFEVRFGMAASAQDDGAGASPEDPLSSDAPVPFDLGAGETILFRGQIDRIDLTADQSEARVIDYKSGRLEGYEDHSHRGGTALQLPVYILAAERLLAGGRVREAAYRSISRRGGFEEVVFGRDAWDRVLADLRDIGRIAQRGVADGIFFHRPDEAAQCKFCDYRAICGEARVARFEGKRTDPAAASFLEFKRRSEDD